MLPFYNLVMYNVRDVVLQEPNSIHHIVVALLLTHQNNYRLLKVMNEEK